MINGYVYVIGCNFSNLFDFDWLLIGRKDHMLDDRPDWKSPRKDAGVVWGGMQASCGKVPIVTV